MLRWRRSSTVSNARGECARDVRQREDYRYLSTNGGKATTARIMPVLAAGLDSLKFSINAGTPQTYALVHGVDDFDEVLLNVQRAADHRATSPHRLRLLASFVETNLNRGEFQTLVDRIGHLTDDVIRYPFMVIGTPLVRCSDATGAERPFVGYEDTNRTDPWNQMRLQPPCHQPWNFLNVKVEGYLSACCGDFNNDLIVGDLRQMTLMEAWHSRQFQILRKMRVERRLDGTLCDGCLAQEPRSYSALNLQVPHQLASRRPLRENVEFRL